MGKLFYLMGKSASGKDKFYELLTENEALNLKKLVLYTTRPRREHETDGVEYHFVTAQALSAYADEGRVIEQRDYETVHGVWSYATVDDGSVRLSEGNYIGIGTLESYAGIRDYYGAEHVVPIYIEVEDGERIIRAVKRERKQNPPRFKELCRRFLADSEDFSEENLRKAGITRRFDNTGPIGVCLKEVEEMIQKLV